MHQAYVYYFLYQILFSIDINYFSNAKLAIVGDFSLLCWFSLNADSHSKLQNVDTEIIEDEDSKDLKKYWQYLEGAITQKQEQHRDLEQSVSMSKFLDKELKSISHLTPLVPCQITSNDLSITGVY
jgi:hypothetical protein